MTSLILYERIARHMAMEESALKILTGSDEKVRKALHHSHPFSSNTPYRHPHPWYTISV